ncbi:hypothetical protein ABT158_17540 [Nonomuraea sp. NPDC001636]|uniref:hypothetical protein n=1 Tax=Nonomuraea sp. NPDC001636 TaxID=3154391 RepID=UPI003318707E
MLTTLVVTASLLLTGAPAQSAATKPLTFRGMTLQIPAAWKVGKEDRWGIHVRTGRCDRLAVECRGFYLVGPEGISLARHGNPYSPEEQYHPGNGLASCVPDKRYIEDFPGKLVGRGVRPVGAGHKATYRVWRVGCSTQSAKRTGVSYQERIWHLPKSKILVFDQWSDNRLGPILQRATWS